MNEYAFTRVKEFDPRLSRLVMTNMVKRAAKRGVQSMKIILSHPVEKIEKVIKLSPYECWKYNDDAKCPVDFDNLRVCAMHETAFIVMNYIDKMHYTSKMNMTFDVFVSIDSHAEKFTRISSITYFIQPYGSKSDDEFRAEMHCIHDDWAKTAAERIENIGKIYATETSNILIDLIVYCSRVILSMMIAPVLGVAYGLSYLMNNITTFKEK